MAVKFYLATWSGCLDYLEKGYPHKNVCIKTYWFKVFVGNWKSTTNPRFYTLTIYPEKSHSFGQEKRGNSSRKTNKADQFFHSS